MRLQLPPGWLLEDDGAGTGCATRTPGACELRVVLVDVALERTGGALEEPDPEGDLGWYLGTDVPACAGGEVRSRLVVRDLRPVGDRRAAYREWDVTCAGDPFLPARPRLWWLPRTRLAFVDESDDPAADQAVDGIVRTADLSRLDDG